MKGELMGVPEAISRLGHPVALPALASGALPVIVGNGARRVRRVDVARLSTEGSGKRRERGVRSSRDERRAVT
jgi:hypothetical protein